MLLAEMLREHNGPAGIEIVAFNGEDYFNAAGQMHYLSTHGSDLHRIALAINVDDVGYVVGDSAYSTYGCPDEMKRTIGAVFARYAGMVEGESWRQGDHMIFVQKEIPAVAITSERMAECMATITHTDMDTPDKVDCARLVEVASALADLLRAGLT